MIIENISPHHISDGPYPEFFLSFCVRYVDMVHMCPYVYICVHMCTYVYICVHGTYPIKSTRSWIKIVRDFFAHY